MKVVCNSYLTHVFKCLLIFERERERERERGSACTHRHVESRGRAETGRQIIPSSLHAVNAEPDVGLELTNCELVT